MKKILQLCLTALVAAVLVVALGAGINSCSEGGLGQFIKGPGFSETADTISAQPELSYELTSPVDAVAYQVTRQREVIEDSVFRSMDPQVVSMVTQVLLKTKPVINVADIVQEYQSQSQISYDKLAKENKSDDPPTKPKVSIELMQEGTTTVTEAQPTEVSKPKQTSISSRDTMIDGKKAKITTTVEKYE